MQEHLLCIATGTAVGGIARLALLRVDYRAYPSYPHSYLAHLALGLLAALTGATAPAALSTAQYDAVTFLLLVATQFRDVRRVERDKLAHLERIEMVPRGANYIEGIAEVFEVRNYYVMFCSSMTSALCLWWQWPGALALGFALIVLAYLFRRGQTVGDMALVREGRVHFTGPGLYVDDTYIMNVGLAEVREQIEAKAMGVLVEGKTERAAVTLSNVGQRQAMLHDLVRIFGSRQDVDTPEFSPMARKEAGTQKLALYFVPVSRDADAILAALRRVPVLENAKAGQKRALPQRK